MNGWLGGVSRERRRRLAKRRVGVRLSDGRPAQPVIVARQAAARAGCDGCETGEFLLDSARQNIIDEPCRPRKFTPPIPPLIRS